MRTLVEKIMVTRSGFVAVWKSVEPGASVTSHPTSKTTFELCMLIQKTNFRNSRIFLTHLERVKPTYSVGDPVSAMSYHNSTLVNNGAWQGRLQKVLRVGGELE